VLRHIGRPALQASRLRRADESAGGGSANKDVMTMRRFNNPGFIGFFDYDSSGARKVQRGRRNTVNEWETGLLFRFGKLVESRGAGAFRRFGAGYSLRRVDLRPWVLPVPTQEVPTADGITVKVTVAARVRVADAKLFVESTQNAHEALYLAVQIAVRELIANTAVEQLLAGRAELSTQLLAGVRGVETIGVAVEAIELKDIILPADLKRAQAAVVVARAEGLAALERARGENAALRSLANAARLAADNPALLQLRLVQELGESSGHTVVIGGDGLRV